MSCGGSARTNANAARIREIVSNPAYPSVTIADLRVEFHAITDEYRRWCADPSHLGNTQRTAREVTQLAHAHARSRLDERAADIQYAKDVAAVIDLVAALPQRGGARFARMELAQVLHPREGRPRNVPGIRSLGFTNIDVEPTDTTDVELTASQRRLLQRFVDQASSRNPGWFTPPVTKPRIKATFPITVDCVTRSISHGDEKLHVQADGGGVIRQRMTQTGLGQWSRLIDQIVDY
jgi:hypothetical protein